jgi:type I restriction enzyme S subunit
MNEQSGWPQKALSDIGELVRGRRFTKNDYVESGLGCIHYAQIYTDFGTITRNPLAFLAEDSRARMVSSQLRPGRGGEFDVGRAS